ncbi:hypothetical protein M4951_06035 [Blastopirellula sp. J2-11]|uniref:hypothetical protein n=1 Tax=Blastopirellula sp. J2-11 TaxID=2943192 RepID=UPI0021C93416|nr:hypothetical protein [Blastopirellula sp. J2-11]UUO07870.1 hypothetical protein M4951_06035 [Blastopirellula sp. J2-11]
MEVELKVDPASKEIVSEAIDAVEPKLLMGAPESEEHIDGQSLIAIGLDAAQHLDALSVVVGYLLSKYIKIHIEVRGIPLTANTLKEGLALIRNLKELLADDTDAAEFDKPKEKTDDEAM